MFNLVNNELTKALKEAKKLKKELKAYNHNCKLNSKGNCKWCKKVDDANLHQLKKMLRELDEIRADAEAPTPSNTEEAMCDFGVDFNGRLNRGKIL